MKFRPKIRIFLGLLLVASFFASSVSAEAQRENGARPFFSETSSQAIDLYKAYPEIPTTEVLDERISPNVYNDVSSPGLMVRSLSLWATNMKYSGIIGDQGVCSSFLDSKCSNSKSLSFVADYLPCMNSKQTDCISRFAVESSPGVWEDAEPISPIFGGDLFVETKRDPDHNYPSGGAPYLWKFPTYQHRGGALFMPLVQVINYGEVVGDSGVNGFKFSEFEYKVSVQPYSPSLEKTITPKGIAQPGYTLLPDTFISDKPFKVEFRTLTPWQSWVRSGITNLEIKSSKIDSENFYSVTGSPARIPGIYQIVPWTEKNLDALREIDTGGVTVGRQCDNNTKNDPYKCWTGLDIGGKANFDIYFNMFAAVEKYTTGRATTAPYLWLAEDVPAFKKVFGGWAISAGAQATACLKDVNRGYPIGITSTNATMSTDGPPAWNAETQSLEFRMAALHQLPDGKTFKGNYTLQIPAEVAKCLWGANASMGTASIKIIDEDGEQKIATISSSITKEYFRFSANGFHFSSPRISIAFKAPIAKKTTIICIKGKTVKKVTASKPVCPAGYKKK
jgi:hypothetical protein